MKIVLWIGNESNQKALAHKIHKDFPLAGIITETRNAKSKLSFKKLIEKVYEKVFLSEIGAAWWGMKSHYEKIYPHYPEVPTLDVENINSESASSFTNELKPDLIIVSGTRLVKEKMLHSVPEASILNLHTGLSPYVKGGPNCTNWCISTEQYHLIGNTIMWIDKGIDTGNIITTECTPFVGTESLTELHLKVMEHAHDLYVRSIQFIASGKRSSVRQNDIAEGITYFTKQWTLKEKIKLIRNMKAFRTSYSNGSAAQLRQKLVTVPLP